jgi:hypothetical protein
MPACRGRSPPGLTLARHRSRARAAMHNRTRAGTRIRVRLRNSTPIDRAFLSTFDERRRRAVLRGAASPARRIFEPDATPRAEGPVPIVHGLYWLVVELVEEAPLVVVIDHGQWADGPSLRTLAYLVNRLDAPPWALSLRPSETPAA